MRGSVRFSVRHRFATSKFFEVVLTPPRSWPRITANELCYRAHIHIAREPRETMPRPNEGTASMATGEGQQPFPGTSGAVSACPAARTAALTPSPGACAGAAALATRKESEPW